MINQSYFWKQPLLEMAERIKSFKIAIDLTEEQIAQLEKDIFIGFYSIRKLFEAPAKLTDSVKATKLELSWYPSKGNNATWLNNHKLDYLYDFEKTNHETRDVLFICGRLIHSFIFMPSLTEDNRLDAIFFTSDTDKDRRLYCLSIEKVIKLFETVGNDYPTSISHLIDIEKNQILKIS